jgi:hypothetical protein
MLGSLVGRNLEALDSSFRHNERENGLKYYPLHKIWQVPTNAIYKAGRPLANEFQIDKHRWYILHDPKATPFNNFVIS